MVSDDFGQSIKGMHLVGDTIVSTDRHVALFGKKVGSPDTYQYLTLDATSGNLVVDISNTPLAVTTNYEYLDGTTWTASPQFMGAYVQAVRKNADAPLVGDGELGPLQTDSNGFLKVAGTLNVVQANSTYIRDAKTAVKDTPITVVTETPASVTEYFTAIMVSGAGQCEWNVWFGTTGSEAIIMSFWTTPSHPTEYVDLPDYLQVTTAQTVYIEAVNREKAASTASDFSAKATLVRKA